jgi:DNA (cytosine-5)-methyltransferase 1
MIAIDFFCGAGGLTKGLSQAGIKVIAGIDIDERNKLTFEKNNSGSQFVCKNIKKINYEYLKKLFPEVFINTNEILFAGCAPCQSFSQQRRSNKIRADKTVLGEFGRIVEESLPGQILIENVPGMAKVAGNSIFKKFLKLLEKNKYNYKFDVLNAKDFGVPQNRKRLVLIGSRNVTVSLPTKTHGIGLKSYQTVRDTIYKYPEILAGQLNYFYPNHYASPISKKNLERLMATPEDGGSRLSWNKDLILKCHKNGYKGHTDVYGRMFWNKIAPTLTGKCCSISNGRYGHPTQNRAISLREAAALQTFPDDYIFYGTNTNIAQQIGNAVPPLLGKVLGMHILSLIRLTHMINA